MISTLLLMMLASAPAYPEVPLGRPTSFDRVSDLQIDGWLRWNRFYHSANVYRCKGLSQAAAERRLEKDLGSAFIRRQAAISRALKGKYRSRYQESTDFLAFGYVTTPQYCRKVRYVVTDMLKATGELERRLKVG